MKRLIRNAWVWILGVPTILFGVLVAARVPPDWITVTFGLFVFLAAAVVSGKYVLRAPALVWDGDTSKESQNIVGWSLVLLSVLETTIYRWVFIGYGRPEWLTLTYWNPAFIITMFVGFVMVAYSTRRVGPPMPPSGKRFSLSSVFVGLLSGIGLMASGALPFVGKVLGLLWQHIVHLVPFIPK